MVRVQPLQERVVRAQLSAVNEGGRGKSVNFILRKDEKSEDPFVVIISTEIHSTIAARTRNQLFKLIDAGTVSLEKAEWGAASALWSEGPTPISDSAEKERVRCDIPAAVRLWYGEVKEVLQQEAVP